MRFSIFGFVLLLLLSCNNEQNNSTTNVVVNNCNEFTQEDFFKFCADYRLDVSLKYPISQKTRFFIWEKYGVNLYSLNVDDLDPDSCNRRKSFQYYLHKIGIDAINNMYKDLDSLILLEKGDPNEEYDFFKKYALVYDDGKYSNYLIVKRNVKLKRDSIFSDPRLINDSAYFDVLDNLSNLYRKTKVRDNLIYFWYVIDKNGELVEIEITNQNCPDSVKQNIFNHLKTIKRYPAKLNGKSVEYRGYDFF